MAKRDNKKLVVEEGKEFVAKTIVGGRPRKRRKAKLKIPVGIERILYKAAIDPAFKKILLEDRIKALDMHGINLIDSEDAIFNNVSDEILELMISRIRPEKHGKRRFMKSVAAVVVTLATGTASVSCGDKDEDNVADVGITPDIQDLVEEEEEDSADIPEEISEVEEMDEESEEEDGTEP